MPDASSPIGIFDSGVGGLPVLAETRRLLPGEDLIYYADSAHFPYGSKSAAEIRARADAVTRELLARDAKLIIVACNTATSAAVAHLRATYDVPFVGMEPALKPAAERSRSRTVALLVTPQTAKGGKLASLVGRFGAAVDVRIIPAPDLAERVERGELDAPETAERLRSYLSTLDGSGADVLALGCTHYAFLRPMIERQLGDSVLVIEPSEAVARQAARLLDESGLRSPRMSGAGVLYLTSGDAAAFAAVRARLSAAGAAIPEERA